MKVIQAQKVKNIEDILREEGSSIIVFPETSFNRQKKKYLKKLSLKYNSTLIGTYREKTINLERVLIIKKGERFPSQFAFLDTTNIEIEDYYNKIRPINATDKFYNVSPNKDIIKALIRICSDMNTITKAEGKADLLIIPSRIYHPFFNIDNIKKNLKDNALIVYSIKDNQSKSGIFNLDLEQVGIKKKGYKVYDLNH